ncbi:hypothetical protein [Paenibacillus sp. FSL K6-0108]
MLHTENGWYAGDKRWGDEEFRTAIPISGQPAVNTFGQSGG